VVVNIVDPHAIVLGGGVSNVPGLAPRVQAALPALVFSDGCDTPVLRAVHGDSSGIRGAAYTATSRPSALER
jgi:fructokinase